MLWKTKPDRRVRMTHIGLTARGLEPAFRIEPPRIDELRCIWLGDQEAEDDVLLALAYVASGWAPAGSIQLCGASAAYHLAAAYRPDGVP